MFEELIKDAMVICGVFVMAFGKSADDERDK